MVTLADALGYSALGWSVIPMKMATKRPAVRWKRFQTRRPDDEQLGNWFNDEHGYGLAVIFGGVSGGLASRDFDDLESYQRWADAHPELAKTLTTVETRRGRHVYCRFAADDVAAFRRLIGKPDGTGAIRCDGGELRIGVGCYSVIPPSLHPSGFEYRWLLSPFDGPIPLLTVAESGFFFEPHHAPQSTQSTKKPQRTQAIGGDCGAGDVELSGVMPSVFGGTTAEMVERAICGTLPPGPGHRNKKLFEFAQWLRGIPELAGADLDRVRPFVWEWYCRAKPRIATQAFEETWADFIYGWGNVKHPKGTMPMDKIVATALSGEVPVCVRHYDWDWAKKVAAVCRELQRIAGDAPFRLDTRATGTCLGVDHSTVSRCLTVLKADHVIELVKEASFAKHLSAEYCYLGDCPKVGAANPGDAQRSGQRC